MGLNKKEMASYGIGAVGKDMVYMFCASYILYYYQDILGVSAIAMGIILMAARVFDAFNDPVMGVIVAKTRTRWGKFRPWLFVGTALNAVVLYLMFAAPPALNGSGLVALCSGYIYFMGCYIYDDGHSVLVNDSCIYGRRQGAGKYVYNGSFMCRSRFCNCYSNNNAVCLSSWKWK